MRIDVHAHYWTDDYLDLMAGLGKTDTAAQRGIGAGGALPMLLQRADDQYAWEYPDTPERPSVAARRMWYDSVGHGHIPALRCAIESFGADRLVLGTDFPYESGDVFVRAVDYVAGSGIPDDQAEAILERNATELLGIGSAPSQ